ncbi:MAG: thiamine diphosphokinase [Aminipila sp.]
MNKCYIFTAYINGGLQKDLISFFGIKPDDFIICADGGYKFARGCHITPNLLIGDFDSFTATLPPDIEKLIYPSEKDDTDTMLSVKYAVENNFDDICIIGGLGGRLDHTISNLQSLSWAIDYWTAHKMMNNKISICDYQNRAMLISNQQIILHGTVGETLSLISYSEKCTGITTKNLKWELKDAELTNSFPLGISNEFMDDFCQITVLDGKLLIVRSID